MRSSRPGILALTILLCGCHAYVPAKVPIEPARAGVRFRFERPRDVVVTSRDALADTLHDVAAVYGRVTRVLGDSVTVAVRQVRRGGRLHEANGSAVIDRTTALPAERYDLRATKTAAVVVGIGVVAAAALAIAINQSGFPGS